MHTRLSSPKNKDIGDSSHMRNIQARCTNQSIPYIIKFCILYPGRNISYFWETLKYESLNHKSETHYHKNDVGNAKATSFIHNRTPEKYHCL